ATPGHPRGTRARREGVRVGLGRATISDSKVIVRVPATAANLGSGFDCLGMALGLYNVVTVEATRSRLTVRIIDEGEDILPHGVERQVLQAMRAVFRRVGKRLTGLSLELQNAIPLARGLGSSAAATVAGLVAANSLCGDALSRDQILTLAIQLEGHPDNVAPALLGGMVVVVQETGRVLCAQVPVPAGLKAALFVPDFAMLTKEARRVLPRRVERADAVYNIGRAALLVAALAQGRLELLDVATRDRLHQPYREALFPAMPRLFGAAREAGALGVFLSGAGSTVLALCQEDAEGVTQAMAAAAREAGIGGRPLVIPLSLQGAEITLVRPNMAGPA
ncbi:MAG: homoserine kinase, partial [Chloroflexota bacterium]